MKKTILYLLAIGTVTVLVWNSAFLFWGMSLFISSPRVKLASLNHAIRLNPHYYYALLERGYFYLFHHDLTAAEKDFRKAFDLRPSDSNSFQALGMLSEARNEDKLAFDCFTRALELEPSCLWPHLSRAAVLRKSGDRSYPVLDEADYLKKTGRLSQGIVLLDALISHQKDFVPAYEKRAVFRRENGATASALEDWSQVIRLTGNRYVWPFYYRAVCYRALGENELFLKDIETTLSMEPSLAEPLFERASYYDSIGDYGRASEDYYRAGLDFSGRNRMSELRECVLKLKALHAPLEKIRDLSGRLQ